MTLCQYYDKWAIAQGYKCWNTACAKLEVRQRDHIKKLLKKEFKEIKNVTR